MKSPIDSRINSPKSNLVSHLSVPQTASTKSVKFLNSIEILNEEQKRHNKINKTNNFLTPREIEPLKIITYTIDQNVSKVKSLKPNRGSTSQVIKPSNKNIQQMMNSTTSIGTHLSNSRK